MADCYIVRRGGGGLNLEVVGGTTQPSNPKENTIWVNTSAAITSWVFSAEEPETPVKGMVWIVSSTSSNAPIEFGKKGIVVLYPLHASQYDGTKWIQLAASVYIDGSWVDLWNGILFDNGDQYEAVTGGWEQLKTTNDGTVEITNVIYCNSQPDDSGKTAFAHTVNLISLDGYSTLKFTVSIEDEGIMAELYSSSGEEIAEKYVTSSGTHNLDISSISGAYRVSVGNMNGRTASVSSIWLER